MQRILLTHNPIYYINALRTKKIQRRAKNLTYFYKPLPLYTTIRFPLGRNADQMTPSLSLSPTYI